MIKIVWRKKKLNGGKEKKKKVLHVFLIRLDPSFLFKLFQERNDSHSPSLNAEKFMVSSILTLPDPKSLQAMGIKSHSNDKNVKPMLPSLSGRTRRILVTTNLPLFTLL